MGRQTQRGSKPVCVERRMQADYCTICSASVHADYSVSYRPKEPRRICLESSSVTSWLLSAIPKDPCTCSVTPHSSPCTGVRSNHSRALPSCWIPMRQCAACLRSHNICHGADLCSPFEMHLQLAHSLPFCAVSNPKSA